MNTKTIPSKKRCYLISQAEVDKIDDLVSALNLAIAEILENQPFQELQLQSTEAQNDYDDKVGGVIYRGNLSDHF